MNKPKLPLLLGGLLVAGLVFLAWTQTWVDVELLDGATLAIDGSVASPAASILALTVIVLLGALAIAGPFFRAVLGGLEALLGFTIGVASIGAVVQPIATSAPAISSATGVAGAHSVAALVTTAVPTAWPWIALIAAAMLIACGVLVIVTSPRWPASTRKYSAVRTEPADAALANGDGAAESWDALSAGDDPTR